MDVRLTSPGTYVVAVSGGVDSMVLLHRLRRVPGLKLVVAHFDHGIRPDSSIDREFVQAAAGAAELPFIYETAQLGPAASEATARQARYKFLQRVRCDRDARAIVTAHHRDDALETAIINLLRGSGRKGLTALDSRAGIERPLLAVSKRDILAYARQHRLQWREDSTNQDTDYLRNYVRHRLLARFSEADRERLWRLISGMRRTNQRIDALLLEQLREQPGADSLDRDWFVQLPHSVAKETLAAWLRDRGLRDFDRQTLERLVVAAKTAAPGKQFDVLRGAKLAVRRHDLALADTER